MVKSAYLENGKITIKEVERPVLEDGAVLLKTSYSEVCGTDVHLQHEQLAGVPYPIIPGHVSAGVIDEINGEVSDVDGKRLEVGDRVTFLDVHETCNACWYCLVAKQTTRCPQRKVYGITYSGNEGLLGGWSEYIYLKPGVKILKLPDNLDPKIFMAAGCGLPTAIHAIQRANIKLGDTVVVQGSGPVGLMAAILSKINGAFEVITVGAPDHRLEIARDFGVDQTVSIEKFDSISRVDEILKLTHGRGADVVIEATGVPTAVKEGLQMCRDGGTYVIVGQYTDAGNVSINPHLEINKKHLSIKGCWGSDFSHFYLAVKFMAKFHNKFPWESIISREYSLEEAIEALGDVEKLKVMKAIIKPN